MIAYFLACEGTKDTLDHLRVVGTRQTIFGTEYLVRDETGDVMTTVDFAADNEVLVGVYPGGDEPSAADLANARARLHRNHVHAAS